MMINNHLVRIFNVLAIAVFLTAFLTAEAGASKEKAIDELTKIEKTKRMNFFEIQNAVSEYYKDIPADKRRGWKQYKRWENFWRTRVTETGDFPNGIQIYQDLQRYLGTFKSSDKPMASPTWQLIGPIIKPHDADLGAKGLGRINIVRLQPGNTKNIWVGSASGGVWNSTDGGSTWINFPFTQFLSLGVSDIAISPSNPNIVYVATGDMDGTNGLPPDPFSIGLIKTTDGGASWSITKLAYELANNVKLSRVLVHPQNPDLVIVGSSEGIFKTADGGETWKNVSSAGFIADMELKPNNPNIVYASTLHGEEAAQYINQRIMGRHGKQAPAYQIQTG
ncbi:MAG: hypothetical protein QG635_2350 [Bacteroidota bacterium]|nr:hypothetical protein [Bacteroidota bacterium]